jgi:hypothetical protein
MIRKTAVDVILGPLSAWFETAPATASLMHRIGEIPNNCKYLWTQVGREPAAVQLLFSG